MVSGGIKKTRIRVTRPWSVDRLDQTCRDMRNPTNRSGRGSDRFVGRDPVYPSPLTTVDRGIRNSVTGRIADTSAFSLPDARGAKAIPMGSLRRDAGSEGDPPRLPEEARSLRRAVTKGPRNQTTTPPRAALAIARDT